MALANAESTGLVHLSCQTQEIDMDDNGVNYNDSDKATDELEA